MPRTTRRTFVQSAAAAAVSLPLMHRLAYAAPADGWIELFDGKTLGGWHKNPTPIGHGTGGTWRVEEGSITGEQDPPGSGNGGILLSDKMFGDFELSLDIKPDWGICSGLFLRGNDKGQCFQMMVDYHDMGNVGQIYGEGLSGFTARTFDINGKLADGKLVGFTTDKHLPAADVGLARACEPQAWVEAWKIDDWNQVRVLVQGKHAHITTHVNDLLVCEFDGGSATTAGYDKDKVVEQLGVAGSIAVQVHGGQSWPTGAKCRWKNIRLRPISA